MVRLVSERKDTKNAERPAVARVAVDGAVCDRLFDYAIPAEFSQAAQLGVRVKVPFGARTTTGYIVELAARSEHPALKSLLSVDSEPPFIDDDLLKLCRWMAEYYCAPIETCVRTVLPAPVRRSGARFREQVSVSLGTPLPAAAAEALRARAPKQADLLDALRAGPAVLSELLRKTGAPRSACQALVRKGLVVLSSDVSLRDPLVGRTILPTQPLPLMAQQEEALALIRRAIDTRDPRVVLLYGVTGSGKTEVYLQALEYARRQERGAIMLVPEISLTPQTVERFVGRFGPHVAVLHSHLSEGERHDEWHRVRSGAATIVVGARSAVFAPVRRLGLILVDEEHEPSYKQEEAPRYHARDVAVMRGHMLGCPVVLGSATPSMESWANATKGKYALARMPARVDHRSMPHLRVVDMRQAAEESGQPGVFSRELLDAIRLRLDRAEQTILFLNRRGYASSLICRKCGYVAGCTQCSISCTYHRHDESLKCHMCGAMQKVPSRCPACGDPEFKYTGVGTQRVEQIVRTCFPKARIERMDADTTGAKGSHERLLGDFRSGRIDILLGTQMIAKGLDFPNVTLVGVIYADLSLHLPDFRAGERTYQLLAQVAGRAGRGDIAGEVIVQTYTPFHPAVQAVRNLDFENFIAQDMEFRRDLGYPPFGHLVCLGLRSLSEERVAAYAARVQKALASAAGPEVTVGDPAPAPIARIKGWYRYQILLRSRTVRAVTVPLVSVLRENKLPSDVHGAIDVDAVSVL
jgi:primosomal protein N' (replication factor Y)